MRKLFQYFELSLAEQRGFILLSVLVVCIASLPYFYEMFRKTDGIDHELIFLSSVRVENDERKDPVISTEHNLTKGNKAISAFDPNGLSIEQWNALGLSIKQAQVIKNYEAKGGKFLKKEDLAKIYSISDTQYKRLAPFIRINEGPTSTRKENDTAWKGGMDNKEKSKQYIEKGRELSIDIMNADSAEWVKLQGIGPVFARRIVNYRRALGGFNNIAQIAEVYGLPQDTYESIKDKLYLPDNGSVKKINVNECTVDELARHPYISKKEALWIVNYRDQHGFYKNLESLMGIELMNRDFLRKIEPYLEF